MPAPTPPLSTTKLNSALARLLRPLVRLFVQRGMTYPAVSDLLRELYVNVAEHEFALPGKDQTDSRVSLLTGINRKEVRRLRGAGAPVNIVPASVSRTSRILARWLAEPGLQDAAGRPLPLARVADAGEASFETLVASVTRDLRPRAVLDEWLDRKLVTLGADDRVTLLENAFLPRGGDEPQLYYFGRNLHDHIAAAVTNILGDTPRFLERSVHYDGLSEAVMRRLEARSRDLAVEALQEANREAHRICDSDGGGTWRWNFGIYIYAEADPPRAAPEAPKGPAAPEAES